MAHAVRHPAPCHFARTKAKDDAALCAAIARHEAFLETDLILGFFAVRGEPDLSPLYEEAQRRGIPVAFPRCVGKELFFHTVKGVNELLPDRYGIPAPAPEAPLAHVTERTLCLLPGLAAGRDGTRLAAHCGGCKRPDLRGGEKHAFQL